MSIIHQIKQHPKDIKKDALLKTLDQYLFLKCDTQFRNKMKAVFNEISNNEASTSAKSTPTGVINHSLNSLQKPLFSPNKLP